MTVNRNYSSNAVDTILYEACDSATGTIKVASTSGWPNAYPFTIAVGYDTSNEELMDVTAITTGSTYSTINVTRGVDSVTAKSHNASEVVKHVITGRDLREAQNHIDSSGYASHTTAVHGLGSSDGVVVGTDKSQTLTSKTLTSPIVNGGTISTATISASTISGGSVTGSAVNNPTITGGSITGSIGGNPTFTGTIVLPTTTTVGNVSATELAYVDGVTSAIQTQLDAKAPLASPTFTGTVTLPTSITGATGAITANMIADGSITDTDINASAAIVATKITGTTAQFNTALSDNDFATLAGKERLSNKKLDDAWVYQGAYYSTTNSNQTLGGGTTAGILATIGTRIMRYTGSATSDFTWTMPTGTLLDSTFPDAITNDAFDFSVINSNSGTGYIILGAATGVTIVGYNTVGTLTSGLFRLRKTGTATWVAHRIA